MQKLGINKNELSIERLIKQAEGGKMLRGKHI